MKRLLSLAAMLLVCCVTLFAQQALWGGAAVVSPDIHDDNTVTFRLKAPKAVRVQITGDFLPPQTIKTPRGDYDAPGIADLTEGKDGVWEFTTPEPLKPKKREHVALNRKSWKRNSVNYRQPKNFRHFWKVRKNRGIFCVSSVTRSVWHFRIPETES